MNATTFFGKSFLTVDNVVLNKAHEITSKINAKYNRKDIDVQDVLIIMESEFRAIATATKKGESVKLPYIGKVCIKPKKVRFLDENTKNEIAKVHSMPNDLALLEVINGTDSY